MGYLVIKNGNTKKSYLCTNTCNKPRIKVSNSYIPLTGNNKSGVKCKVSSSNIAEYNSYTYTGNQGTITTGTTYQTRASTYNTVYGTYVNSVSQTFKYIDSSLYRVEANLAQATRYAPYTIHNIIFKNEYGVRIITCYLTSTLNESNTYSCTSMINDNYKTINGTAYFTINTFTTRVGATGWVTNTSGYGSIVSISYQYNTITTGTTYQTRASTYNTLYGTKTTNKTLTSSSWG